MEVTAALERSYEQAGKLFADLSPDQLSMPSPCSDWDVRAMLNHTLGALWMFTLINEGKTASEGGGDLVGDNAASALAQVASANVESWRRPGALEGDRVYPFGTFPAPAGAMINLGEICLHTWDLAKATGRDATLDPEVATLLYGFYREVPLDVYREHGAFGPEVAVPETAPAADRLLGLLGRQP